ncbi:helix-turn-helix domain-containing protein [Priestia aryabhattai]|uniref:MarR family winged helix-turn-helix transcriptional regulator n=1 Tax=Priestia aryabhattai TaxID=412384 RepID=UPI003100CF44
MVRRKEKTVYWGAFILEWFGYLQDHDLSSSDYRILFFLCQNMKSYDNSIYMRQKQISEELNMDKGNVSKCIKKLCEKQFIVKIPNGFMVNPHLFYVGKGHPGSREELRDNFDSFLRKNKLSPRFYLNELERKLELDPNEIYGEDEDNDEDDFDFTSLLS